MSEHGQTKADTIYEVYRSSVVQALLQTGHKQSTRQFQKIEEIEPEPEVDTPANKASAGKPADDVVQDL